MLRVVGVEATGDKTLDPLPEFNNTIHFGSPKIGTSFGTANCKNLLRKMTITFYVIRIS
jgi:hypothetical protein